MLEFNGFSLTKKDDYALSWKSSPETDHLKPLSSLQKFNHFPFSKQIIGHKGNLANIIQNHPKFAELPEFFPQSYVLPKDRDRLYQVMQEHPDEKFIIKPPKGSYGNGIRLFSFNEFFKISEGSVVSVYISRPLTIDSFKFDLRIYVLVTSFSPLSAFIYRDGLARFATEKYSNHSNSPYSNLTNATLNKKHYNWNSNFKWTLKELLNELQHRFKQNYEFLFQQIVEVVSNTLALVQPAMTNELKNYSNSNYFELYGFDILFDNKFHPWLLEVNTFPSMGYEEGTDFIVKAPLIAQTLSIAGIPDYSFDDIRDPLTLQNEVIESLTRQIELEDERNKLSGSGFLRIFPSTNNVRLQSFLYQPKLNSSIQTHISNFPKEIYKDDDKLTFRQYSQLFVIYLKNLVRQLDQRTISPVDIEKLNSFLTDQGFRTQKSIAHTYLNLEALIKRIESRILSHENNTTAVPKGIINQYNSKGKSFMKKLFSDCPYAIAKNQNSIF